MEQGGRATVLIVEPERGPRESLRMILAPRYAVLTAESAAEARERLRAFAVDVATVELRLPDARGPEWVRSLRRQFPRVGLVVVSAQASFAAAAECLRQGVADYVVKPFDVVAIGAAVARALGRSARGAGDGRLAPDLAALARAAEARDPHALGHGMRVAHYAELLAGRIGLDGAERARLRLAAQLHDVGKLGVAATILTRRGPLDARATREMRRHAELGARLLEGLDVEPDVAEAVRHHHERWNGRGYPTGARGEAIPLAARVIQVADAFDAITSERCYRAARSWQAAAQELVRCAGSQFDAALVKEFVWMLESASGDDLGPLAHPFGLAESLHESAAPSA